MRKFIYGFIPFTNQFSMVCFFDKGGDTSVRRIRLDKFGNGVRRWFFRLGLNKDLNRDRWIPIFYLL